MASHRHNGETDRRGRPTLRAGHGSCARARSSYQLNRGRVRKRALTVRDSRVNQEAPVTPHKVYASSDARDAGQIALPGLEKLKKVPRVKPGIHACSEWSLDFVTQAKLETDEDTNTICLNLMDHFLFTDGKWLPELSYCKLHAACFLFASEVTEKSNTFENVAKSLAPDAAFVQLVAAPLVEDEDSAVAISDVISVDAADAERVYALLYERSEELAGLMGEYGRDCMALPLPMSGKRNESNVVGEESFEEELKVVEDENFDVFEETV